MGLVLSEPMRARVRSLLVMILAAMAGGDAGYAWAQLSPSDKPAWAAAVGSIVSGLAALGAAIIALYISDRDRRAVRREKREQGHVCAWYLTTHLQRAAEFSLRIHRALLAVDISKPDAGYGKEILEIESAVTEIRDVLSRIDMKMLLLLPHPVGKGIALAVGALPLNCDAASLVAYRMRNADQMIMSSEENFTAPAKMMEVPLRQLGNFFIWHAEEFSSAVDSTSEPLVDRIREALTEGGKRYGTMR